MPLGFGVLPSPPSQWLPCTTVPEAILPLGFGVLPSPPFQRLQCTTVPEAILPLGFAALVAILPLRLSLNIDDELGQLVRAGGSHVNHGSSGQRFRSSLRSELHGPRTQTFRIPCRKEKSVMCLLEASTASSSCSLYPASLMLGPWSELDTKPFVPVINGQQKLLYR